MLPCLIFISLFFLSVIPCPAQTLQQALDQQINPLKNLKGAAGIVVLSADDGKTIYEFCPDLPLAPASNQKLVTTVSALATLGPDFQFITTLGKMGNDLVVIGDGDPGLGDPVLADGKSVTDTFDQWAGALKSAGLTVISGKIIFDDSIFDRQFYHPNWPQNQANRWYAAPIAGLNLNDNCLDLSLGFDADKRAQLVISPACESLFVDPVWIQTKATATIINPVWVNQERLKVVVRLGSRPVTNPVNITVRNPHIFFATLCRERLEANGIKIAGPIVFQKVRSADGSQPPTLTVIAQYKTPIFDAVNRANKNSQNFFAECLFKRLGYHVARKNASFGSGTWTTGQLAVKEFIQDQVKSKIDDIVIDDGCGLSKNNRVTARLLAQILLFAKNQPWADRFTGSLSIAGVDGTLKRRMRHTPAAGKVYAKTGTIDGVKSLSGYVLDGENKPRIVFVTLFNFPQSSPLRWQSKTVQDRICIVLAQAVAGQPTTQATTQNALEQNNNAQNQEVE